MRDIVSTCGVLHNMLKSHQEGNRPDQAEQGHFRNLSREAKDSKNFYLGTVTQNIKP